MNAMTNTNCLENIVCPQCGHTDSFIIEVKTRADVSDEGAVTFGEMQWDEWSLIQCKNCDTADTVAEFTREPPQNKQSNRPYSVLLLYPDTGDDSETYYTHTEAKNADEAIAKACREAEEVNNGLINASDFLPLIVLAGHIEAELFYRDIVQW
jgi:hypothetical protein